MNSGEKILIKKFGYPLSLKTQKLKIDSNLSRCIASICQGDNYYTTEELIKQVCYFVIKQATILYIEYRYFMQVLSKVPHGYFFRQTNH